jgi:hypothetical protein
LYEPKTMLWRSAAPPCSRRRRWPRPLRYLPRADSRQSACMSLNSLLCG